MRNNRFPFGNLNSFFLQYILTIYTMLSIVLVMEVKVQHSTFPQFLHRIGMYLYPYVDHYYSLFF